MVKSIHKLQAIGADLVICPSNSPQKYISRFVSAWLNIADAVAAVAKAKGYSKILLLGTSFTFNSSLNPNAFANVDAELLLSNQSEQAFVHSTIVNELNSGVVTEQAKGTMKLLLNKYQQAGADAVILGCTELPLIINAQLSALATIDSTTILGDVAIQAAKSSGLCISSAWLLASCSRLST